MPEEIPGSTAASPAEPAAAATPADGAAKLPSERLADLSSEERLEWRKTGKLPDAAPAASATATADGQPAATAATSEPDSEPAEDDPQYKPKTAARIKKLLEDNKRLAADLAAARQPPASAAPAASATAPAASTLVKPDPEKFTYGTADPEYLDALTDYKIAKKAEDDRAAAAENDRKTRTSAEVKRIQESWKTRVDAAKIKHADFEKVVLDPNLDTNALIPQGSFIDSWILESEHGAEVAYELLKPENRAELMRLRSITNGIHLTREMVNLENRLAEDQPKVVTSAPEPGAFLTARSGDPTKDPVKAAIKKGDAGAYIREANERELAKRRRK